MLKTIKITSVLIALTLSFNAHGADVSATGTISILLNHEGQAGPLVQLSNMIPTVGACARNDYYVLPLNHLFLTQNYALLLSAKMVGKQVSITVAQAGCLQGFPRIRHISVSQ